MRTQLTSAVATCEAVMFEWLSLYFILIFSPISPMTVLSSPDSRGGPVALRHDDVFLSFRPFLPCSCVTCVPAVTFPRNDLWWQWGLFLDNRHKCALNVIILYTSGFFKN